MNYDAAGLTEFDIRQMSITFKYIHLKNFTKFSFLSNKSDWFSIKNSSETKISQWNSLKTWFQFNGFQRWADTRFLSVSESVSESQSLVSKNVASGHGLELVPNLCPCPSSGRRPPDCYNDKLVTTLNTKFWDQWFLIRVSENRVYLGRKLWF